MANRFEPQGFLARNDSYHYFDRVGGIGPTGSTGTNVMDMIFLSRFELHGSVIPIAPQDRSLADHCIRHLHGADRRDRRQVMLRSSMWKFLPGTINITIQI